jgi:hypothetical protein
MKFSEYGPRPLSGNPYWKEMNSTVDLPVPTSPGLAPENALKYIIKAWIKEYQLKGMDQYNWPPCAGLFSTATLHS